MVIVAPPILVGAWSMAFLLRQHVLHRICAAMQLVEEMNRGGLWALDMTGLWWQRLKEKMDANISVNKVRRSNSRTCNLILFPSLCVENIPLCIFSCCLFSMINRSWLLIKLCRCHSMQRMT